MLQKKIKKCGKKWRKMVENGKNIFIFTMSK